ncbi:hypothetical protein AM1_2287 [Acaryochloris marina MBIC11017]|uniref:Uncharacterized protein n=1 Tax=Acaryochloris marina (strain MBIC 11017) TaxID=329726 RepID=B0C1Z6_ACAM1|nr:hypothetical protein AM1_2287 [Acaryochloris marina MBIC11017]
MSTFVMLDFGCWIYLSLHLADYLGFNPPGIGREKTSLHKDEKEKSTNFPR